MPPLNKSISLFEKKSKSQSKWKGHARKWMHECHAYDAPGTSTDCCAWSGVMAFPGEGTILRLRATHRAPPVHWLPYPDHQVRMQDRSARLLCRASRSSFVAVRDAAPAHVAIPVAGMRNMKRRVEPRGRDYHRRPALL